MINLKIITQLKFKKMNEINFVELKNIYECVNLLLDYYGNQNIINVGDKNIADK